MLETRTRRAIKPAIPHAGAESAPDRVGDLIARHAAERASAQNFKKTPIPEKLSMRQYARQQQRDITLDHCEKENSVDAVLFYELVEKMAIHARYRSAVRRRLRRNPFLLFLILRGLDDEHGTRSMAHHCFGSRTEKDASQTGPTVR